ncbi:MAG: Hsp20/alpha crystallin family protein [Flavipsychrobacter sp.]|nr:Hsp20/alpha crystallin family protein [Flavipsychrobacter sp.]
MYSTKNNGMMTRTIGGLMDEMFNGGWNNLLHTDVSKDRMNVPVNIRETDAAYTMQVIAPGLKKEDFKIQLDKNVLNVSFEHKEENKEEKEGNVLRSEYSFRSFKRSFTLNDKIDNAGIAARYTDGVLEVTLPKKENVSPATQEITIA